MRTKIKFRSEDGFENGLAVLTENGITPSLSNRRRLTIVVDKALEGAVRLRLAAHGATFTNDTTYKHDGPHRG